MQLSELKNGWYHIDKIGLNHLYVEIRDGQVQRAFSAGTRPGGAVLPNGRLGIVPYPLPAYNEPLDPKKIFNQTTYAGNPVAAGWDCNISFLQIVENQRYLVRIPSNYDTVIEKEKPSTAPTEIIDYMYDLY
jgi:hypothetical protein